MVKGQGTKLFMKYKPIYNLRLSLTKGVSTYVDDPYWYYWGGGVNNMKKYIAPNLEDKTRTFSKDNISE